MYWVCNNKGTNDTSIRVYYRRERAGVANDPSVAAMLTSSQTEGDAQNVDSGHGTMANRRSTPLSSSSAAQTQATITNLASPYSTLGKSYATTEPGVDLLHDKWADLMDQYLDNKFKSACFNPSTNYILSKEREKINFISFQKALN